MVTVHQNRQKFTMNKNKLPVLRAKRASNLPYKARGVLFSRAYDIIKEMVPLGYKKYLEMTLIGQWLQGSY